ncbi:amidohydrolase [Apiospora kogelbergensis]|uniref:Amidohydrolase n=1 Tax=Apiospora kogelbergensis TaxID=1337665 RepID=A0AAW0QNW4_9PEZI
MIQQADLKPWFRPPPKPYLLANANIIDVEAGEIRHSMDVKVEDGKFTSISPSSSASSIVGFTIIDCTGRFLCPGLIDSHVHLIAVPGFGELSSAFGNPESVSLLRQPYVCGQMLGRGFTSVRDCGGAGAALRDAVADGVFPGPRLFLAGHALSQSGGHADFRGPHDGSMCCGGATTGLGRVCNGVPQCMQAVREEVRGGADFVKIMGSGASAARRTRSTTCSSRAGEIRAMVACADNAGTYVTAHAYTAKAIRHCVDNGVRGIEHGNFLDAETAALMREKGVYLTPTLITYHQMASPRWTGYLPPESQAKNTEVLDAGLRALKIAHDAGVTICFGTDLLGPLGAAQTHEFALRSQVLSPVDVLRSATLNPAKMLGWESALGQIREGYEADVLILSANPLKDVTILDQPDMYILGVMKEGRMYKSRIKGVEDDAVVPVRATPHL